LAENGLIWWARKRKKDSKSEGTDLKIELNGWTSGTKATNFQRGSLLICNSTRGFRITGFT